MGDLRILILLVLSFCILNSVYADVFTVSPDVAVVVDDPVIKDAVRTQITLVDAGMTSDEIPVAVTVSSLVDDATGLVLLPLNGDEHVFMLEKGSSFPFYFRYSLTDDVKDKGGHFEGKVSFTYNSSTLDVSVTYDREPKKISSGIYAEQGSSSSILRVELDDIKIEGQSDGNDAAVGNGEDLHFGDEVDIELTLRHASGSSLDFLRIDYIDLVSNDLELDAEITSDDDDKLSSGERTRADILFTLPSLEELALEDIASEYLLQIVVGARDEDGERHEVILPVFLRVERESRSLEISSLSLSSDILYCGNSTLTVTGTVTNYGTKTERDVRLSIDMYSLNRSVHHVFNALSPLSKQEFSVDIPMVILPSATQSAALDASLISGSNRDTRRLSVGIFCRTEDVSVPQEERVGQSEQETQQEEASSTALVETSNQEYVFLSQETADAQGTKTPVLLTISVLLAIIIAISVVIGLLYNRSHL